MIDFIIDFIIYGYGLNLLFFIALFFLGFYENLRYPHVQILTDLLLKKLRTCQKKPIPYILIPYAGAYDIWRIYWKSRKKPRNAISLAMLDVEIEENCKE